MEACPDEDRLQGFVEGTLSAPEAARVEAHVDRCEGCRLLVAQLGRGAVVSATLPAEGAPLPADEREPPRAGDRVGRYTLLEPLGSGAMGMVFAAHDPDLDRKVALKLVASGRSSSGSSARSRVLREAKAIARLAHPNVVAVHEVGTFRGEVFLAMELVDGGNLRFALREGVRSWREVLDLFLQAGEGLVAAHAVGLVHRDFKPENVLIGKDGRVRVGDFGLARVAEREAAEAPADPAAALDLALGDTLTQTGALLGTPAYMAPEQLRGGRADARADQFAFAVALHEALHGARPFRADSLPGLATAIEVGEIDQPARSDVPPRVDAVIRRALSAAPDDRYPSMAEMLAALRAAADAAPRRSRVVFGVAIALALFAIGAGARWMARPRATAPPPSASSGPAAITTRAFRPREVRRLTYEQGCEEFPSFLPGRNEVLFDATFGDDSHIVALDIDSGARRTLTDQRGWQYAPAASPDGKTIAYLHSDSTGRGAYVMSGEGSAPPRRVGEGVLRPAWSPDGTALWTGDGDTLTRLDPASGSVSRTMKTPATTDALALVELTNARVFAELWDHETKRGIGVAELHEGRDADWLFRAKTDEVLTASPDEDIVFTSKFLPNSHIELWQIPVDGSPPRASPDARVLPTKRLSFSRDGRMAVWSTCGSQPEIARLVDIGGGAMRVAPLWDRMDWTDDYPTGVPGSATALVVVSERTSARELFVLDTSDRAPARRIPTPGLVPSSPAVSNDGRLVAFVVEGQGIHVVPIDGAEPPRRLTTGAEDTSPSFSRDGRAVWFQTGDGRLARVPVEGGDATVVPGIDHADAPAASPAADLVAYVAKDVPMLYDVARGKAAPLSREVPRGPHPLLRFSPDGRRVAVLDGFVEVVEIDLSTRALVRRYASSAQIAGLTYQGDDILLWRVTWQGDLWLGIDPFP